MESGESYVHAIGLFEIHEDAEGFRLLLNDTAKGLFHYLASDGDENEEPLSDMEALGKTLTEALDVAANYRHYEQNRTARVDTYFMDDELPF